MVTADKLWFSRETVSQTCPQLRDIMNHWAKMSIRGYAGGRQEEFPTTVTSEMSSENEFVIHGDLSADHKKTDSREMLDSGP